MLLLQKESSSSYTQYKNVPRMLRYRPRTLCRLVITLLCLAPISLFAQHGPSLAWTASTTPQVTYKIYSGTTSGGPYSVLFSGLSGPPYQALNLISGQTGYYVVTAVSSSGESSYSNEVSATAPGNPPPPPTSCTFGNAATSGFGTDSGDSNYITGSIFNSGACFGTATSVAINISTMAASPNNLGEIDVYSAVGNSVKTLIAHSSQVVLTSGMNTIPISFNVAASTSYFVGYNTNGTTTAQNDLKYSTGTAPLGSFQWMKDTFGTYPTTFVSSGSSNKIAAILVSVNGGTTPPPQGMTTICTFSSPLIWTCNSTLQNIPIGQTISSTTTTGTITNSTSGTVPASLKKIPKKVTK